MPNDYDDVAPPPVVVPGDNPYLGVVGEFVGAQQVALQASLTAAAEKEPDRQARVLALSAATKLPSDVVDRNLDVVARKARLSEANADGLLRDHPKLAGWLSRPENAALAQDDLPVLRRFDRAVRALVAPGEDALGILPKGFRFDPSGSIVEERDGQGTVIGGFADLDAELVRRQERAAIERREGAERAGNPFAMGIAGGLARTRQALGLDDFAGLDAEAIGRDSAARNPSFGADLARGAGGIVADLPLMLSGGPLGNAFGALARLGRVRAALVPFIETAGASAPLAAREGVIAGREHGLAAGLVAGGIETLIPAAFGRTGVEAVTLGRAAGKALPATWLGVAGRMLKSAGLESAEEATTELAHAIHEQVSGIDPQALAGDRLLRRLSVAGALGGLAGGAFSLPEAALGKIEHQAIVAHQAVAFGERLSAVAEVVGESKTGKRMPEAIAALAKQLAGDHSVYLQAEEWDAHWLAQGVDPAEAAARAGAEQAYREAKATRADLGVPLSALVGDPSFAQLAPKIRQAPGAPSAEEAAAFGKGLPDEIKRVLEEQSGQPAASGEGSAETVGADVAEQLIAAGVDHSAAEQQGKLYASVFRSLGQRAGVDPLELYRTYGLTIERQVPEILTRGPVDDLDHLLDRLRSGQVPSDRDVHGPSLVDFLRKTGITDEALAGELRDLQESDPRRPGERNLVRPDGRTLDDARVAAIEAGYLGEDADLGALLAAIEAEVHGTPTFAEGRENPAVATLRQGLLETQRYLEDLGIDLKGLNNQAVKLLLAGVQSAPTPEGEQSFDQQAVAPADGFAERQGASLSVGAQAFIAALPDDQRALLAPALEHLRRHPDPQGDLGNLRMVLAFERAPKRMRGAALETVLFQPAYHGSPHKFDKFTTDNMGSGEGNQAFGWGLYFAGAKEVATYYRDVLGKTVDHYTVNGVEVDVGSNAAGATRTPYQRAVYMLANNGMEGAVRLAEQWAESPSNTVGPAVLKELAKLAGSKVEVRTEALGRLYTVDIPDDGDYLLWDKPLSEQSEKVREAIRSVYPDADPASDDYDAAELGQSIYLRLASKASPEETSKALLAAGIRGIKYLDGSSRAQGDGTFNYVIFDGADVAIREYEQAGEKGARGKIRFGSDRKFTISLLGKANLSTFLHETGHFYLEVLGDLAERPDASPQIRADYQAILGWFGVEGRRAIATEHHETWARGFEAYLMEGKAPSSALRSVFARFRSWLLSIYKSLTSLRVDLTPEVRSVMDRLVATDEEIAAAADEQGPAVFTAAEQAGMSQEEFLAYQGAIAAARQEAEERLTQKLMVEVTREKTAAWKAAADQVRADVTAQLDARPDYLAAALLTRGTLPDGSPLPVGTVPFKLDRKALEARYGDAFVKRLPRGSTAKGGVDPDLAAERLGFSSGDELAMALAGLRPRKALIEAETAARMRETHGDMLTDGSAAEEAAQAVHSDAKAKVLERELTALVNQDAKVRKVAIAIGSRVPRVEVVRAEAKRLVAAKVIRSVTPVVYQRAESKAGREAYAAVAKGDYRAAIADKQREILNHELYRASVEAREETEQAVEYLRGFLKPAARARLGKAGADYLEQVDGLLAQYELAPVTLRRLDRRQSLRQFVEKMDADGIPYDIPQEVIDAARQVNYREVSVEFLLGLRDTVKSLHHLATHKNQLLADARKRDLAEAVGATVRSITEHIPERAPDKRPAEKTGLDRFGERLDGIIAAHRKLSSYARQMDGGEGGGAAWELLVRPLNAAADREVTLRREASSAQDALWKAWSAAGRDLSEKVYIPAIGTSLTLESRLMVALNWGNEGNRERLLAGETWEEAQAQAVLDTLTAPDWTLVQGIWDQIDAYWPEIAAKQRRVTGLTPEKVAAAPVETRRHGTLRGGYFPVAYDRTRSPQAERIGAAAEAKLYSLGDSTRATTRRGHTKERQAGLGKPLELSLDVVGRHLSQVIHDLTHHEAIIDANRILNDATFAEAVHRHLGGEALKQFRDVVKDVAAGDLAANGVDRGLRWMRSGVSIATMGFNATSAAMQATGLAQSAHLVGVGPMLRAVGRCFSDPSRSESVAAYITAKSQFMRNRSLTANREVSEVLNSARGDDIKQTITRYAYWMMQKAQQAVDMPTWLAAYENAQEAGHEDANAVMIADQAVIDTQGSGLAKDRSGVERSRYTQLLTVFYSFFNTTFNRMAESVAGVRGGQRSLVQLAADFLLLVSVPATMTTLLRAALKGDDDEERTLLGSIARAHLATTIGTMIGLREIGGAIDGFDYRGPAGTMAFTALSDVWKQSVQGEFDGALVKAAARSAGILFHLPSNQAIKTIEGLMAWLERPSADVRPIFFGAPR